MSETLTQEVVLEPLCKIARWADQLTAGDIDALRFTVLVGRELERLAERAYGIRFVPGATR